MEPGNSHALSLLIDHTAKRGGWEALRSSPPLRGLVVGMIRVGREQMQQAI